MLWSGPAGSSPFPSCMKLYHYGIGMLYVIIKVFVWYAILRYGVLSLWYLYEVVSLWYWYWYAILRHEVV